MSFKNRVGQAVTVTQWYSTYLGGTRPWVQSPAQENKQ